MSELYLPLFPVDNSSASVTFTVWVGVVVVVFFHLRFGWTLSGLVVPGYLVPLLLVKPMAAAIIGFEAIVTYLAARLVSDGWTRLPWWSSVFGRDRFFLIVVLSVLVRAVSDGWFLPFLGNWLNEHYSLQIDYRNDLHSYGLIVVALIANYFWKPRLASGLFTGGLTLVISYGLIRYLALNITNFSVGALHCLYEDIATSLLASPKAYVVLVTTAWIASWLNLRYSWDFNGILLPALLALLWHEPFKLLATFAESLWVLFLATCILRLPPYRQRCVEGAGKLLLFFSVAAAHRITLAHLLPLVGPIHVTDYYGFGYLLTTLLAVRAHDRQSVMGVVRATIQASMLGAVLASLLGFALSQVDVPTWNASNPDVALAAAPRPLLSDRSLWTLLNEERVRLYASRLPNRVEDPVASELSAIRQGLAACHRYQNDQHPDILRMARRYLRQAHYALTVVQSRYLLLRECSPQRGWGVFVIDLQSPDGILLEVPAALDEQATLEAGFVLFQQLAAGCLAIAARSEDDSRARSSGILEQRQNALSLFHREFADQNVLQVRGWSRGLVERSLQYVDQQIPPDVAQFDTQLFVRRALPRSLRLSRLQQNVSPAQIHWQDAPWSNLLRERTEKGFAELVLSQHDGRRLRNRVATDSPDGPLTVEQYTGPLNEWLQSTHGQIARQNSGRYVPPLLEEMVFLDEEIVRPLFTWARRVADLQHLTTVDWEQLAAIGSASQAFDYRLVLLQDPTTGGEFAILAEQPPAKRCWGTFVFRVGTAQPFLVEVPRPLFEQHTHAFGVAMFARQQAMALLLAGSHPCANLDATADPLRFVNKINPLQLTRQVLLRETGDEPLLIVQSRAIRAAADTDVIVAADNGAARDEQLAPLARQLVSQLRGQGLAVRLADGSPATAGYEISATLAASSLSLTHQKSLLSLWVSPVLRWNYRASESAEIAHAQFAVVGIDTLRGDLYEIMVGSGSKPLAAAVASDVRSGIQSFVANSDVVQLAALKSAYPTYRWLRVVDLGTDQSYLLVQPRPHQIPAVFNLDGAPGHQAVVLRDLTRDDVRAFAQARLAVLEVIDAP